MAGVTPGLLEAAAKAGMPGVSLPEPPADTDDDIQNPGTPQPDEVTPDKGAQPEPPESGGDEDDLSQFPENYFGENIKEYAEANGVEAAKAYFKGLQDANRVGNRRLQEIAELRKAAEEEAKKEAAKKRVVDTQQPEPEELSDEELLEQAGIDPSVLQYEELGKPLVAMLRRQVELESKLEAAASDAQGREWENQFFGALDKLQSEHGKITYEDGTPVSKADLEEFAIEINTYDPEALYWRIMGPVLANRPAPKPSSDKRDLKRSISQPRRKGGAAGSTQGKPPRTLAEHLEASKQKLGLTGDVFSF